MFPLKHGKISGKKIDFKYEPDTERTIWLINLFLIFLGHSVPIKNTNEFIKDGTTGANGHIGSDGPETTETDSSRSRGMRQSMERNGSTSHDAVHLQRRLGLFSGVALIVGTMIGNENQIAPVAQIKLN